MAVTDEWTPRACIVSIIRTYYIWTVLNRPDVSNDLIGLSLLSYAEVAIGVIVSCAPTLPRFFQHVGPKVFRVFPRRTRVSSSLDYRTERVKSTRNVTRNVAPDLFATHRAPDSDRIQLCAYGATEVKSNINGLSGSYEEEQPHNKSNEDIEWQIPRAMIRQA